ncbi:MAG: baeC [Evtepia sp.]|jgi:[acyl-carrier-protein] S-malonyltransferase|nr:baeC [Evtepia sp.]
MGKVAFVFPGQGAQHSGMGLSLYQNSEAAKAVFSVADRLRPGTSDLCFQGTETDLAETRNTQPCLFSCELAAAYSLVDKGIRPQFVAGFSLGEVAALAFTESVSLEDGFQLVIRRGELMQADAEKADSAMAAVLKLDTDKVEELCAKFAHVYPVNYNCPGQITVACLKEELAPFSAAVKEAGGRALPLKVRGGFHSVFMEDASREFALLLQQYSIARPSIPLYSNFTGLPYDGDFQLLLSQQICNPVRWETIVRNMLAEGVDTFFEVGPGTVLSGLIKKIAPEVQTFHVEEYEDLESVVKEYHSC